MAGILYAPELLAPPPVIWLPNDVGGIARSEAFDLQRHHNLRVTLDVRATEDVLPFRPSSPHTRVGGSKKASKHPDQLERSSSLARVCGQAQKIQQ